MANQRNTGLPIGRVIEEITGFTGPISEFVEGPEPDIPVARELHQQLRKNCDSYSRAPSWFTGQTGGFQIGVGLVCDDYLDSVGSGPPVISPPAFTGGQCSGDDYNIFFDAYRTDIGPSDTRTFFAGPLTGPIVSINAVQNGTQVVVSAENEAGQTVSNSTGFTSAPLTITNGRVVNTDDPSDPCGDPPGGEVGPNPSPRPDPGLDPEEEPFTDPKGRPVFPGPEIPNPFGDPVKLPNLPMPNPFVRNPEDTPSEPAGGEPVEPGDKGEPDPTTETGSGGEEEQTDTERWLMGIFVEVIAAPPRASGLQTSAGFVYTEAGFVYQGAGDELEYFEESERLLSGGQYFPATRGYDTWRVVASPFYNLRVTPFYKEKEE
jgi:hypothetical protein